MARHLVGLSPHHPREPTEKDRQGKTGGCQDPTDRQPVRSTPRFGQSPVYVFDPGHHDVRG